MKIIVLLALLIGLSGCQFPEIKKIYDIKEVSNRTYLINQETGKLSLVKDGKVIQLSTYSLPDDRALKTKGSFFEKIQFDVSTKQIEDRVYYILNIEGFESKKTGPDGKIVTEIKDFSWFESALPKYEYDYIKLQFVDVDGFTLKEHTIKLSDKLTHVVDRDGQSTGLKYEGNFKVNPLILSKTNSLQYVYYIDTFKDSPQ